MHPAVSIVSQLHGRGERNLPGGKKRYAAARGDSNAGPTQDEVQSAVKAFFEPTPNARVTPRAQLGSSVAFGSGCGQALPGVPRKAPLC